jgi:hypothetical protein
MDICIQQMRLITLLEEIYILKVANFTLFSMTDHACVLLEFGLNLSVLGKPGSAFKHHDVWVAAESFDSSLALFDRVFINDCRCKDLMLVPIFQSQEFGTRHNGFYRKVPPIQILFNTWILMLQPENMRISYWMTK